MIFSGSHTNPGTKHIKFSASSNPPLQEFSSRSPWSSDIEISQYCLRKLYNHEFLLLLLFWLGWLLLLFSRGWGSGGKAGSQPRLASDLLSNWGWPWTSDPPQPPKVWPHLSILATLGTWHTDTYTDKSTTFSEVLWHKTHCVETEGQKQTFFLFFFFILILWTPQS